MILSATQASAVHSAMCALNNADGKLHHMDFPARGNENIAVVIRPGTNAVHVWQECRGLAHNVEAYANQTAFAEAYGLN